MSRPKGLFYDDSIRKSLFEIVKLKFMCWLENISMLKIAKKLCIQSKKYKI